MLTLYDFELSAGCHRLRLFLGLAHALRPVDVYPGRERDEDRFRDLNPPGEVPVLVEGTTSVSGAGPAMVYLGAHYGADAWYPVADAPRLARGAEGMSVAERLARSAGAARLHEGLFGDADVGLATAESRDLFRHLDRHLWSAERGGDDWLCPGPRPTIADVLCFPDVARSEEGGIAHLPYPAVRRGLDRAQRLPGFVAVAGVFPAGPAAPHIAQASQGRQL